jgi:copper chaperone NosL
MEKKNQNNLRTFMNIISYLLLLVITSCKATVEPIDFGNDACAHCKMTIVDHQYATELITAKGRAYKFDDIVCMKGYVKENLQGQSNTKYYVADYNAQAGSMLEANKAAFIKHEFFSSPMNGNIAAFATNKEAARLSDSLKAAIIIWNDIK